MAQDVISAAEYQIKQMACAVTISGLEMLQNAGKEQIIDLLEARISVAESTLANRLSESIYSDGSQFGGKELTGLKLAVSGAATGTYGGINRATFPFWRNQAVTASATLTATTIQAAMNSLYAKMVRGADKPNVILFGNNLWTLYLSSLQAIQRFNSSDSAAAGFSTIKYMNSDVVLDSV